MKPNFERLIQARKTAALVDACSVSIEEAVRVARTSIGGTVVDAKLKEKGGRVAWRIKLLTGEGRVKIYIDGHSGSILEAKREEPLTASDGMMIPEVVVVGHMQTLESAPS